MHKLFLITSTILLLLLATAAWQGSRNEWSGYQKDYFKKAIEREDNELIKASLQDEKINIKQLLIPSAKIIDRCTTCHTGIENPRFSSDEHPFRNHPGNYLRNHPIAKFGCTLCHDGQGQATTIAGAHSEIEFWEFPMIGQPFIQGNCEKCHMDRSPRGAEIYEEGKEMFEEYGCSGCHSIKGVGEKTGPDLTTVGAKYPAHPVGPNAEQHLKDANGSNRIAYIIESILEPDANDEESLMPPLGLEPEEAKKIAVYLSAQRDEHIPGELRFGEFRRATEVVLEFPIPENAGPGERTFLSSRCFYCHRVDDRGEDVGPSLYGVGDRRDREWIVKHFKDPRAVSQHSFMPDFKLSADKIEALTDYVMSLEGVEVSPEEKLKLVARDKYEKLCVYCHGKLGAGDGPAAEVLDTKPTDFTVSGYWAERTDEDVLGFIANGKAGMPGFDGQFSEDEIKALLEFLKTLKR